MKRGFDANQDRTYVNIAAEFCGLVHGVQEHIVGASFVGRELLADLHECTRTTSRFRGSSRVLRLRAQYPAIARVPRGSVD